MKKNKNNLIKGNQSVLKARFSDAKFFIQEDKKKKLHERIDDLNHIVFYEKIGSLHRSHRISNLVNEIYKSLGMKLDKKLNNLLISNADLSTELVKEFLKFGKEELEVFWLLKRACSKSLCTAISDQYNYEFPSSYKNLLTFVLSIAQKFDGIVGCFISKKKISGSGDPFGVRRSTLSIIKICIEKKLGINFFKSI